MTLLLGVTASVIVFTLAWTWFFDMIGAKNDII